MICIPLLLLITFYTSNTAIKSDQNYQIDILMMGQDSLTEYWKVIGNEEYDKECNDNFEYKLEYFFSCYPTKLKNIPYIREKMLSIKDEEIRKDLKNILQSLNSNYRSFYYPNSIGGSFSDYFLTDKEDEIEVIEADLDEFNQIFENEWQSLIKDEVFLNISKYGLILLNKIKKLKNKDEELLNFSGFEELEKFFKKIQWVIRKKPSYKPFTVDDAIKYEKFFDYVWQEEVEEDSERESNDQAGKVENKSREVKENKNSEIEGNKPVSKGKNSLVIIITIVIIFVMIAVSIFFGYKMVRYEMIDIGPMDD